MSEKLKTVTFDVSDRTVFVVTVWWGLLSSRSFGRRWGRKEAAGSPP